MILASTVKHQFWPIKGKLGFSLAKFAKIWVKMHKKHYLGTPLCRFSLSYMGSPYGMGSKIYPPPRAEKHNPLVNIGPDITVAIRREKNTPAVTAAAGNSLSIWSNIRFFRPYILPS